MWFAGAMPSPGPLVTGQHPTGLLLAAGAGRRMGGPKALVRAAGGEAWVVGAAQALHDGGCDRVLVVTGAESDAVAALVEPLPWVEVITAEGWAEGMGPSLVAGLSALKGTGADCAVVGLVDTPDVGAEVVRRVVAMVGSGPEALGRAGYDGIPGHPVVLGRDHWPGVAASATGDRGARAYLAGHPHRLVECGDLATGADVDTAPGLE
jgi:CTP:molybdopterin cytidylyltransferase MocA